MISTLFIAAALNAAHPSYAENSDKEFNVTQKEAIQKIVHDYLVNNPQVLIEASQTLRKQEQSRMMEQAQKAIPDNSAKLFDAAGSHIVGNAAGDITLVEFYDFQCGYCRQTHPMIQQLIDSDKKLRVVYKELPIFGEQSEFAAKAVLAAREQNKYKELHKALFALDKPLTQEAILKAAKQVGLNINKLRKDMDAEKINRQLQENLELANALGLRGTPAFVVASYPVSKEMKYFFIPGVPNEGMLRNLIHDARTKTMTPNANNPNSVNNASSANNTGSANNSSNPKSNANRLSNASNYAVSKASNHAAENASAL
jgi:protein-disulfide isomerase